MAKRALKRGGDDMKKTIKVTRKTMDDKDFFVFSETGQDLFNVECSSKTIKGKDLYEKIYQTDTNETVEVTIDQSGLEDADKKAFGNYVVALFDSINAKMKEQFPDDSSGQESA